MQLVSYSVITQHDA